MPPLRVVAGYLLLVLIWGSTWGAIKIGVEHVPPFVFAFERGVAVSLVLTAIALVLRYPFPRERRVLLAAVVVGIINTGGSWAMIFWAEQYVPSGLVSVFGASAPVWTALLAHFFVRGDRLTPTKLAGLALGMGGVGLLVGAPDATAAPEALAATILLAFMPLTWALAAVLQARLLTAGSPLPTVAVGTWAGAAFLVPFAAVQAGLPEAWSLDSLLALAYLVVFGSCVGLVLFLWLYRKLRPTTVTLVQVLIPAEAILIGSLALGETVTLRMLGGAALVALAVGLNAIGGGRAAAASTTAA